MSNIKVTIKEYPGYFEVWEHTYDDKGKEIKVRQSGVAVHPRTKEGFRQALALMDPFNPERSGK